jgi:hypothetical protein
MVTWGDGCAYMRDGSAMEVLMPRERIFQSFLSMGCKLCCIVQTPNTIGKRKRYIYIGVTNQCEFVAELSYNYHRARIQLEAVISLLRVPVLNIFTFVMALSHHNIRFASFSSADGFHVSWDRSLCLWMSFPSL